jgi:Ca2+-binding EF-hand superfamily protein
MTLSPEEIEELRESFDYNDPNQDGRIDFGEFREMLAQLDARVSPEEARIGFTEIDTDDDGAIDFAEFADWWSDRAAGR